MALIECAECGHGVSSKATACPNCGAPIERGIGQIKIKFLPALIIIIISAILIFVFISKSDYSRQKQIEIIEEIDRKQATSIKKSTSDAGDVHGAWAYMQLFVERRLKSPKSADFPFGGYRHVTSLGNGRYKVDSYVDAQNAFGAGVRTHFEGVIKYVHGQWQLEYLNFY